MKEYRIEPDGWTCKLSEYRGGHFMYEGQLCFKTEYHDQQGYSEPFCSSGEVFWADCTKDEREQLEIQPVKVIKTTI